MSHWPRHCAFITPAADEYDPGVQLLHTNEPASTPFLLQTETVALLNLQSRRINSFEDLALLVHGHTHPHSSTTSNPLKNTRSRYPLLSPIRYILTDQLLLHFQLSFLLS